MSILECEATFSLSQTQLTVFRKEFGEEASPMSITLILDPRPPFLYFWDQMHQTFLQLSGSTSSSSSIVAADRDLPSVCFASPATTLVSKSEGCTIVSQLHEVRTIVNLLIILWILFFLNRKLIICFHISRPRVAQRGTAKNNLFEHS